MSLVLLFLLFVILVVYWTMTQILPERRRISLLRPGLAGGLLEALNDRRHQQGLVMLEMDTDLMQVAENKATHQVLTNVTEDGWDYPSAYHGMFGRSLLMEMLFSGPAGDIGERLSRQRDLFDAEWLRCGIGVAGGASGQVVVALVVCREAWAPVAEAETHRPFAERFALGD